MPAKIPLSERFSVDANSGCWVWKRPSPNGYGLLRVNGRQTLAHRSFYEMHIGPIPEGLSLDHLCRNPACVNPKHLEPVTQKINTIRGLAPKISQSIATEIRKRYASGARLRDLAKEYCLSVGHISGVTRGMYWTDSLDGVVGSGLSRPKIGKRKLSNQDIELIKKLREEGKSCSEISTMFQVHKCTIERIVSGRFKRVEFSQQENEHVNDTSIHSVSGTESSSRSASQAELAF